MFGNNFRIERITLDARQELDGANEQFLKTLWEWMYLAFKKWKLEQGDRNPIPNRGMLSGLMSVQFETAEPWECADFIISSPIALTLKLMRENYSAFDAITAKVGIRPVLLLAITKSEIASDDDLLDAGNILRDHANAENLLRAGFDAAHAPRDKNLAAGRLKGAKNQKAYAAETWRLVEERHNQFLKRPDYANWKPGERATYIVGLMGAEPDKTEPLKGRCQPNGRPYLVSTVQKRLAKMG